MSLVRSHAARYLAIAGIVSSTVAINAPHHASAASTSHGGIFQGITFNGLSTHVQPADGWQLVAQNLSNPRQIAFGLDGALYIAEAGSGGTTNCIVSPIDGTKQCQGNTGQITRVFQGVQTPWVTGLPSIAEYGNNSQSAPDGGFASGPASVSLLRLGFAALPSLVGKLDAYAVIQGFPVQNTAVPGFDQLIHINPNGSYSSVVDLLAYERTYNPDQHVSLAGIDSDPYSVIKDGGREIVADAAGNDLLAVGGGGATSTLAVFPDRPVQNPFAPPGTMFPMQAVPTTVAKGPDGAYYVGQLTGFPFPVGAANVYRIVPGHAPTIYASGFTNVISIAFGPDGSLYVLEIAEHGLLSPSLSGGLWRVPPGGGTPTFLTDSGLVAPTGIAIGPDHDVYISNNGVFGYGGGQVIRRPLSTLP